MENVSVDMTKLDFSKPITNLLLNIMGGLPLEHLTAEERQLLIDNGYEGEFTSEKKV